MLLLRRCTRVDLQRRLLLRAIRGISTATGSSSVQTLPELHERPKFAVPSRCVSVLERPAEFYLILLVSVMEVASSYLF